MDAKKIDFSKQLFVIGQCSCCNSLRAINKIENGVVSKLNILSKNELRFSVLLEAHSKNEILSEETLAKDWNDIKNPSLLNTVDFENVFSQRLFLSYLKFCYNEKRWEYFEKALLKTKTIYIFHDRYELDKLIELLCETKRWKLAYWAHQKILLGNRNSSSTEIGQATAKAGAYSLSLFFFKKLDCLNNNGSSTFNYEVSKVLRREFWGGFEYFWY